MIRYDKIKLNYQVLLELLRSLLNSLVQVHQLFRRFDSSGLATSAHLANPSIFLHVLGDLLDHYQ